MVFVGCSDNNDNDNTRKDINLSHSETAILNNQNEFAFKVFDEIVKAEKNNDDNIFFSPLSLSIDLSMFANGALGNTYCQLMTILTGTTDDENIEILNSYNSKLIKSLPALDNDLQLNIANSVWIDNGFPALSNFVNTTGNTYNATIKNVDISSDKARNEINEWGRKNTNGVIPEFLKSNLPSTVQVAAYNAIYFKGYWEKPFNKANTHKSSFYSLSGDISSVDMMSISDAFAYNETNEWQCIKCLYGNGAFQMAILLPKENVNINEAITNLNNNKWKTITPNVKRNVKLKLPKFEIKYDTEDKLNDILKSLGVSDMFSEEMADFSGISKNNTYISLLSQKTAIKVNEEGTEAAAITGPGITTSPGGVEYIEMNVNRPFIFIIEEHSTGAMLFMGKVNKL